MMLIITIIVNVVTTSITFDMIVNIIVITTSALTLRIPRRA